MLEQVSGSLNAALIALQQTAAEAAPTAQPLPGQTVWDFISKGGPTIAVIGACSLGALAVIVERIIVLRRRKVIPPNFLSGLSAVSHDRNAALAYCRGDSSPIAAILAAAIKWRGERYELIEKAVEDAGRRELVRLRHRMRLLSALPQVSTMLGLLGTIFGMIKTFQAVAKSAQALGKTELLAKGIFEAWTNTAAGLLVAIPVLVAYHMLLGKIDSLVVEMDRIAVDWVERESGRLPADATAAIKSKSIVEPTREVMPQVTAPGLLTPPSQTVVASA